MSLAVKGCGQVEVVEKWVKIPDVTGHCVQEVAKLAVEQFNAENGDCLKFHSIHEGCYWELGQNKLKYCLHIKAIDYLARCLLYEALVFEEKPQNVRIRKLISFTIMLTSGHCVGPVDPPKEEKWIKIPNLHAPFVQIVAKSAVDEYNKNEEGLKYVEICEGCYMEMGQDNIKFCLHLKVKDCLGRLRNYKALVLVKHCLAKKIKILESFKVCGQVQVVPKWVQIPEVKEHGLQALVKFVLEQFKIKYGDSLKFDSIYEGWYFELCPKSLKYCLHIKVIDFLGRCLKYEVIIVEEKPLSIRIWKLESIIVVVAPGHVEKKWIKIPNLHVPFVIELSKSAVDEYNKNGEGLRYVEILDGWHMEMGQDNIKFCLHLKAKDWLGRIRNFEAVVLVEHCFSKKIKILESFKVCGSVQVVAKWIQIPDVKEHGMQAVVKFILEQFKIKYGDCLKFDSIYEGWYFELCPKSLKYRLHCKATDFLGRCLNYEVIIVEEKPLLIRIWKLESIIVIVTPGHCVGPVDPPKIAKWIKIPNLQVSFVLEVCKFALDDYVIKAKDSLKFDAIYDGWYMEMGQDNINFRIHVKVKDCLGRVHHYEACVFVKHFLSERIKIVESFKFIENKC